MVDVDDFHRICGEILRLAITIESNLELLISAAN